jgi:hypothetical protein
MEHSSILEGKRDTCGIWLGNMEEDQLWGPSCIWGEEIEWISDKHFVGLELDSASSR